MDTRIRLIAEDLTKDAVLALEKLSLLTNELIKNTEQLRIVNERKANAEKKEVQETIGIINNLNEKIKLTTKLRNESNDITQINQYNREISKQESELKKLTDTQQKSNVLSKEQNAQIQALTANTGQSNSMFRNLAATMIGLFAVDRIIDYSKNLLDTAINSQRLDIALKNVSTSNAEYSKSVEYLNDISNKYGQNINNLKETYTQFIAASKTSNLTLQERQRIYESVIQAGSTLQRSNEQIERSLNAVTQMFSKGNISAEELRQQLGEQLPGAFGIMAKALNVSEKQLNKMLEQGEVLAKDALPKFAAVLTEMYGDKAQSNVNTWAGGLNRATNSLTAWVNKTNESLGITEKMAKSANWVADNFGKLTSAIGGVSAALAVYTLRKVASNTIDQIKLINLGREVLAKQAVAGATIELTAAETAAAAAATKFNATVASAPYGLALLAISALVTMLLQYNQAQQEAYERTEEGIKATDQSIKAEKAHGIELATNVEQIKKLAYGNEERIARVKDLMRIYPQYFKDMTAEQVSNWHLTNMYRGVNAEIERKITLMAREKSVQKNTERLAEIKMELEARGVLAKSVQEYYKNEEEKGNWFNTNNLKNTSLLREQTKIYKELETGTYKLRDAQIQMFNQEAKSNKAKLEAGLISKEEFKAEVMRIQEVYNVKVQNYKLEEVKLKDFNSMSTKEKKKALTEQQKLEKENNEFIKAEKEKTQIAISEIENRGEEERAFEREKWLDKIFRIYTSNYTKIKKVTDDTTKESKTAGEKYSQQLKDRFNNDSETIKKRLEENSRFFHSILEEDGEFLKGWYDNLTKQQQNIVDQGISMVGNFLENQIGKIDEAIDKTTDLYEKARLETQKNWLEVGTDAVKTFDQMLSGNVVGSIVGTIKTLSGALDNWLMSNAREERARLEQELVLLKKAGEEFIKSTEGLFSASDIESIKSVYGGLIDTFNTTLRLDFGEFDNAERRLQQEILIGQQIVDNYNKEITNENGLHSQKIDNINSEYNAAVKAINDKYNLEKGLADTAFGAASLAIQEQTNQQLIALLTNQDTRLSLDADYNAKRAYIFNQYASQIKDITPEMSQVEIDGINAAIQARDNALSEVEKWLQEELKFVLSNEEQKREEYSATEKIIKDGEDSIEALRIEYNANELERLTNKNLALESAEKNKNAILETESVRHNKELKRLGVEKDTALAESFKILQDIIKNGYDEIMGKALEAFKAGKITADQYDEIAKRLYTINTLINGLGDWTLPNINIDNLNLPKFNTGTEKVGGKKGVDKNLALLSYNEGVIRGDLNEKRLNAGLNMHKTIEYAINYKSILDGGLQPLKIKESALNKLEEHAAMQYLLNFNMKPVVEELKEVKSVLSKIPIQNFNLDEKGLSKYVETKNNVTKFKNKRLK